MRTIALIRKTTPEEIEVLNRNNVRRLIGNDPKLKAMADLFR